MLNASSVAVVDRDAPVIVWLEQAVQALARAGDTSEQPMVVTEELLPESLRSGWREFVKGHVFWCPLQHPDETVLGVVVVRAGFPVAGKRCGHRPSVGRQLCLCLEGPLKEGAELVEDTSRSRPGG